jgi:FtsH-binding integral membrane protein
MQKVKTIGFWLFALVAVIVAAVVLAVGYKSSMAGAAIPYLALVWMVLALAWMFRSIVRKVRD